MVVETEREPKRELPFSLVAGFASAFISRWDRYPVQLPTGRYIQLPQSLTLDTVAAHLEDYHYPERKAVTIGAYALDGYSQARWVCFDADQVEQWQQLFVMSRNLKNQGVNAYLEASRRGGTCGCFLSQF